MKRELGGLSLVITWTATCWAGDVLLENRGARPLVYQARHSGQETWSKMLTLAPAERHSFTVPTRLVVRFGGHDSSITAVLRPDRRFCYQPDESGPGEVVESRIEEPGRPNTRRLTVLALADETYRRQYPDWQDRIAEIVATASNYFDDAFAIRLRLVECRLWDYEATALNDLKYPLGSLLGADAPNAELVTGWIAVAQSAPKQAGFYTGWSWPFGRYILLADLERQLLYGTAQQLVYRLAHTFGAFPVVDPKSIMQKSSWNLPYPWEFGDTARQVILLSREVDLRLGVKSLDPQNARQICRLYQTHHHPDDSRSDDPITWGFRLPFALSQVRAK